MPLVDFALLTGLTEEFQVLRQLLPELEELSDQTEVWYRTRIASARGGPVYKVVAAFQNEMGPFNAHALTTSVIRRWDPANIILLGIAGSFHSDIRLADVIVSQQVFYYDPGKAVGGGIRYRPQGYPCGMALIRQTEALTLDDQAFGGWRHSAQISASVLAQQHRGKDDEATERARAALTAHNPQVHFGTVASGSLVVASKKKQRELLALHGKIIGTEMEGAGVMHAAYYQDLPTPAIVVKGISDAADAKKDQVDAQGYWRTLAKENSARLALALIRRGRLRALRTDEFVLDPTAGSPAEARAVIERAAAPGVAYLAFPTLVRSSGPSTGLQIRLDARDDQGAGVAIDTLVVTYFDLKGDARKKTSDGGLTVELDQPVAQAPIGVYALVRRPAASVVFTVRSPAGTQQAEWRPQGRGGASRA